MRIDLGASSIPIHIIPIPIHIIPIPIHIIPIPIHIIPIPIHRPSVLALSQLRPFDMGQVHVKVLVTGRRCAACPLAQSHVPLLSRNDMCRVLEHVNR